jgi:signal transduction histidine kinase/ActR/RegA family two-component response regulator
VNFSVESFFNLPTLKRYQIVAGIGAGSFVIGIVLRIFVEGPELALQPTRLGATAGLLWMAALAPFWRVTASNPHAVGYVSTLPLLIHLITVMHSTNLEPSTAVSSLVILAICCIMMDSKTWLTVFLVTWSGALMSIVWFVDEPRTSPATFSVLVLPVAVVLYLIAVGFAAARQALHHKEHLLNETQSFARVAGWEHDLRTDTLQWTPTTYEMLGIPLNEPFDVRDHIVDDEDGLALKDAIKRLYNDEEPFDVVSRLQTASGAEMWARLLSKIIYAKGRPVRAVGIFSDITKTVERERALTRAKEEAEAAANARTQFLANMSHEIRTPMNGVIGMTSLLDQSDLPERERGYVDVIRSSGEALIKIINEILDFAKFDAGNVALEERPFSLEALVCDAIDVVGKSAADKGLYLHLQLPERTATGIMGDESRLRQVLVNLLSNAIKFTERGGVTVTVRGTLIPGEECEITFSVRDTGIGIPQKAKEHLFEAFTQADSSTTRKYGGTGLGLTICKEIVEAMNGTIEVASTPGQGSEFRFTVTVPITTASQAPSVPKRIGICTTNGALEQHLLNQLVGHEATVFDSVASLAAAPLDFYIVDSCYENWQESFGEAQHRQVGLLAPYGTEISSRAVRCITMPVRPSDLLAWINDDASVKVATAVSSEAELKDLKILLAEDNLVNQKVAVQMLHKLGYSADIVSNGREAVEALMAEPYDVVLMDVQMPEVDGLEATRLIRLEEGVAQPYIVALTANAMPEDRDTCKEAGMDGFLAKPINLADLGSVLENRGRIVH